MYIERKKLHYNSVNALNRIFMGYKLSPCSIFCTIYNPWPVMWIRIDFMRIRIQINKITKLIANHRLKVKKKIIYKSVLRDFYRSRLKIWFPTKKKISIAFRIILYPWIQIRIHYPWTQMNADTITSVYILSIYQKILLFPALKYWNAPISRDGDLLAVITDKSPNLLIWDANSARSQWLDTGRTIQYLTTF